jgi:hypothetical protein
MSRQLDRASVLQHRRDVIWKVRRDAANDSFTRTICRDGFRITRGALRWVQQVSKCARVTA